MELFIWEVNYNLNNKQKKQYTPFKNDILSVVEELEIKYGIKSL